VQDLPGAGQPADEEGGLLRVAGLVGNQRRRGDAEQQRDDARGTALEVVKDLGQEVAGGDVEEGAAGEAHQELRGAVTAGEDALAEEEPQRRRQSERADQRQALGRARACQAQHAGQREGLGQLVPEDRDQDQGLQVQRGEPEARREGVDREADVGRDPDDRVGIDALTPLVPPQPDLLEQEEPEETGERREPR
jgi:hypothetical protein